MEDLRATDVAAAQPRPGIGPTRSATVPTGLLEDMERLAGRLEGIERMVRELRGEREALLAAAGVRSTAALLRRMDEWVRAEAENRALHAERQEAATRLRALIDKVDMLPGQP